MSATRPPVPSTSRPTGRAWTLPPRCRRRADAAAATSCRRTVSGARRRSAPSTIGRVQRRPRVGAVHRGERRPRRCRRTALDDGRSISRRASGPTTSSRARRSARLRQRGAGLDRVRCLPDGRCRRRASCEPLVERTEQDSRIGWASTSVYEARRRWQADGAPPNVVVVRPTPTMTRCDRSRTGEKSSGVGAAGDRGCRGAGPRAVRGGRHVVVKPLGLVLTPASMPADAVEDAAELIADASRARPDARRRRSKPP